MTALAIQKTIDTDSQSLRHKDQQMDGTCNKAFFARQGVSLWFSVLFDKASLPRPGQPGLAPLRSSNL